MKKCWWDVNYKCCCETYMRGRYNLCMTTGTLTVTPRDDVSIVNSVYLVRAQYQANIMITVR